MDSDVEGDRQKNPQVLITREIQTDEHGGYGVGGSIPMELQGDTILVADIEQDPSGKAVEDLDKSLVSLVKKLLSKEEMAEYVGDDAIYLVTLGLFAMAAYIKPQLLDIMGKYNQGVVILNRKRMIAQQMNQEMEKAESTAKNDLMLLQEIKNDRRNAAMG